MKAANQGTLKNPAVADTEVRRMLADRRAEALATRFAAEWLRLQDVDKIRPDALLYPSYDNYLAESYKRETELLFDSIVREDRSVVDLLTADYTFVNERIAGVYGIPNITGNDFQRVKLADENRRGILGHGSILMLTSVADRTSPVQRGKWIMEVLLGMPPPRARAHGGAPEEPRVCVLSPRDRSARSRARELRCDGRVAYQGQRSAARRDRHAV